MARSPPPGYVLFARNLISLVPVSQMSLQFLLSAAVLAGRCCALSKTTLAAESQAHGRTLDREDASGFLLESARPSSLKTNVFGEVLVDDAADAIAKHTRHGASHEGLRNDLMSGPAAAHHRQHSTEDLERQPHRDLGHLSAGNAFADVGVNSFKMYHAASKEASPKALVRAAVARE